MPPPCKPNMTYNKHIPGMYELVKHKDDSKDVTLMMTFYKLHLLWFADFSSFFLLICVSSAYKMIKTKHSVDIQNQHWKQLKSA